MKKYIVVIGSSFIHVASWACTVCQKQQPQPLREITHGTGPQSQWDYVIIISMVLIVLISLYYSIKWLIRPGENNTSHIKNRILNFEQS